MTSSEVLKLIRRTPFVSFKIHLSDGGRVRVDSPWEIATSPSSRTVTRYEPNGEMCLIPVRNITEITTESSEGIA